MYRGPGDPSSLLGAQKAAGDSKAAWPSESQGHPELAPEGEPGGDEPRGAGGFWVVRAGGIHREESQPRQQLPGAGELFWEPAHWVAMGKWVTATKPNSPSSHERRIPPSLPQGDLWPLSRNTSRCQK